MSDKVQKISFKVTVMVPDEMSAYQTMKQSRLMLYRVPFFGPVDIKVIPNRRSKPAPTDSEVLIKQMARMSLTSEANGQDLGNDAALDGLIRRARSIVEA